MTIQWLKDQRFEGSLRIDAISPEEVSTEHGVYAVVRESRQKPRFVVPGTGRKGSHYPLDILRKAWVSDTEILYLGRARCQGGIYERLNKYRRFGNGKNSGHSGGRAIWQLEDAQDLKVCWLITNDQDPVEVEWSLIEAYKKNHQERRPFANRIDGTITT